MDSNTQVKLDPVTFAVVRNGIRAAAREMRTIFKRASMLPIIYEYNDFGMSIYDDKVRVLADAPGIPVFLGSLDLTISESLAGIGGPENLQDGDILFNNHPFLTGGHPADAALVSPIFFDRELIGYGALRAHIGDTGAMNLYPMNSTELYQEGTIFPSVKLYERGALNSALIEVLKANSRLPLETAGSVLAGAAALRVAGAKVMRVVEEHGVDTYRMVVDELVRSGETAARRAIEAVPDGTYTYEDAMDDNGVDSDPVALKCTVAVTGSDITIDLTGSADVQTGPINCPWPYTVATCRLALKRILTPDLPPSSGEYAPLTIVAPEGSIFRPEPPAASFAGFMTSVRLLDMITQALAPALPDRIPAENGGDIAFVIGILKDPVTGATTLIHDDAGLGHGAVRGKDGMNALVHAWTAGIEAMPTEVMEARMPIHRVRFELLQDSGGPGEFRGGLAAETEVEFLGTGSAVVAAEKSRTAPARGLLGGLPAPHMNRLTFFPGTDREEHFGKSRGEIALEPGDRAIIRPGGGGGYGDPRNRDPKKVADDVRNGYVSEAAAREIYGVQIGEG